MHPLGMTIEVKQMVFKNRYATQLTQ
jgi:hypothetical protein